MTCCSDATACCSAPDETAAPEIQVVYGDSLDLLAFAARSACATADFGIAAAAGIVADVVASIAAAA